MDGLNNSYIIQLLSWRPKYTVWCKEIHEAAFHAWTCMSVLKSWPKTSAARCQLFKLDSISALSISIIDIIGLPRTSQEYHQWFLRADQKYNLCINFIKILYNILKIKPICGDFVIRHWFPMLLDAGLSFVRNWFWVQNRCWFDILKYCAALQKNTFESQTQLSRRFVCWWCSMIDIEREPSLFLWVLPLRNFDTVSLST